MSATEKVLGELHLKVTEVLIEALDGEELPGYTDPETEEVVPPKRMLPSAAIIAAATKFLKDNDITCVRDQGNALDNLEKKMAERRARRANMNVIDMEQARKDAAFMTGS